MLHLVSGKTDARKSEEQASENFDINCLVISMGVKLRSEIALERLHYMILRMASRERTKQGIEMNIFRMQGSICIRLDSGQKVFKLAYT
jgi:hypothetical protein